MKTLPQVGSRRCLLVYLGDGFTAVRRDVLGYSEDCPKLRRLTLGASSLTADLYENS